VDSFSLLERREYPEVRGGRAVETDVVPELRLKSGKLYVSGRVRVGLFEQAFF